MGASARAGQLLRIDEREIALGLHEPGADVRLVWKLRVCDLKGLDSSARLLLAQLRSLLQYMHNM